MDSDVLPAKAPPLRSREATQVFDDASDAPSCTPAGHVLDHRSGIRNETDNSGPNWARNELQSVIISQVTPAQGPEAPGTPRSDRQSGARCWDSGVADRLSKLLGPDPTKDERTLRDANSDDAHLESPAAAHLQSFTARWVTRGRRFVDAASRARQGRVVSELALLRRSVEDMRKEQGRLEANLQAEFQLRDMLSASESSKPKAAITPLNPRWQLSSQAVQEVVRHVLLEQAEGRCRVR